VKQILAAYILPALISISAVLWLASNEALNQSLFEKKNPDPTNSKPCIFIENFRDNPECESQFLADDPNHQNIFLLGSSELTGATPASPFNFISERFSTKLKAVGHAGNQCFSIYSQLLANEKKLANAPVIIILSPMWFLSKEAGGTSSTIFLEFNSENFLRHIINDDSAGTFKQYENQRISDMFGDFSSPGFGLKKLHFDHQAKKSFLHYLVYKPISSTDRLLLNLKQRVFSGTQDDYHFVAHRSIQPENVKLDWDSLYAYSKKEFLDNATNNNWGIGNDYFSQYIQGRTGGIVVVPENKNIELQDFRMLLKLLKDKKANASFLIIPMNPYFYLNLKEATPLINTISREISQTGFPCLNYWVDDSVKYEKGILKDIMHLSPYGWHKANRFIVETYQLAK
jgi:poly-D-alanine transfer protein DltD